MALPRYRKPDLDSYVWQIIANDPNLQGPHVHRPMTIPPQEYAIGESFAFAGGVAEVVDSRVWCTDALWGYARSYHLR